jgi:hypothetical protein
MEGEEIGLLNGSNHVIRSHTCPLKPSKIKITYKIREINIVAK